MKKNKHLTDTDTVYELSDTDIISARWLVAGKH